MTNRNEIFELINKERDKQDAKWGALPRHLSDVVWLTILVEEVGECAQAILKCDWSNLKAEIIQVATVAIAWLEDDENHSNGSEKAG
jgi:NTP pyrophosphatase (non-canonical NTP hydrolase)